MTLLFIILFLLLIYSYLIYPVILFVISRIISNRWIQREIRPKVSIVISVYNEEKVIEEKLKNTMELEYPPKKLEVIISSDGSNDRTNQLAAGMGDPRIVLRPFPERAGKTACLNHVVPEAQGEIVVFTDANSMFPSDTLLKLVRNFSDQNVGLVTGWSKYIRKGGGEESTGIYSRFEMLTKYWESLVSSCVGADGAIFAIRKNLFRLLRDDDINDFVIPLQVIKQGKRVIMDPEVYCFEEPSKVTGGEYRRQVRISTRTLGAVRRNIGFLNPFKYGSFSSFLISHKLMRFLVPFFLIGTFGINLLLLGDSYFFIVTLVGQLFFYFIGALSILEIFNGRLGGFVKFFLITITAQFVGWFRMLTGATDTVWISQR
jgi:cellulose synthase/poly-beta-1,6-N-acetylglucosamine synthase-like glycosyltransferase